MESEADAQEVNATGVGSMSTFYHGKKAALRLLALEKLGNGSAPFKFKSRAKHSMYKECHECQTKRLAIQRAIKYVQPHLLLCFTCMPMQLECGHVSEDQDGSTVHKRLLHACLLREKWSPSEIKQLKDDYADHLQWMMAQRRKMDQFSMMAHHQGTQTPCSALW